MELEQSNAGDITLEKLQRLYVETIKPHEQKFVTFYCKPNEVKEVRDMMHKIFGTVAQNGRAGL